MKKPKRPLHPNIIRIRELEHRLSLYPADLRIAERRLDDERATTRKQRVELQQLREQLRDVNSKYQALRELLRPVASVGTIPDPATKVGVYGDGAPTAEDC